MRRVPSAGFGPIAASGRKPKGEFGATDFRAELVRIMPGYDWTVHKSRVVGHMEATGTKSSGFNRLSTLSVARTDRDGEVTYTAKSAGFGMRAKWLHTHADRTLARSLRGLQDYYQEMASTYGGHAKALNAARTASNAAEVPT
ncbi:hypothetical protein [Mesorhizobium sp.]|uniref:hypothetical protein n=1 Tax=Mesorhizobium sp. TaxID=1871066 RepID=UPI0012022C9B|nr:hypothetical protein [Mesorhizobium sp.]TIX28855.1 MAG: hypothetical protein E5V35_00405 [Mesorhizobium sp.]